MGLTSRVLLVPGAILAASDTPTGATLDVAETDPSSRLGLAAVYEWREGRVVPADATQVLDRFD